MLIIIFSSYPYVLFAFGRKTPAIDVCACTVYSCWPFSVVCQRNSSTKNSPTGLTRPRRHYLTELRRLRTFLCHTKTNDSFYVWHWHMFYGLILLFCLTGTSQKHNNTYVFVHILLLKWGGTYVCFINSNPII